MEGLFYLLDIAFVVWLLVMVKRNDRDPEAAKSGQLGIFSMAVMANKARKVESQNDGAY